MSKLYVLIASILFGLLSPTTGFSYERSCEIRRPLEFSHFPASRKDILQTDQTLLLVELDETLVGTDVNGELVPRLAASWEIDWKNNDLIFKLSDKCRWSDDVSIKPEDFVLGFRDLYTAGKPIFPSWDVIKGAKEVVTKGAPIETIDVEKIDENTLRIGVVGDPEYALSSMSYITFSPLPSHSFLPGSWLGTSAERVVAGAYKVVSSNRNVVVAKRNKHYCSDKNIAVDQLKFFNIIEGYSPIKEFLAGKVDIIRDVSSKQLNVVIDSFPEDNKPNFSSEDTFRQVYLLINSELNGLEKQDIRAQINAAIDYSNLLEPRGTVEQFFVRTDTVFFNLPHYENVPFSAQKTPYKSGLNRLRETMEKHGYSAENQLSIKIKTWPIPRFVTVARLLASMLKPAHFNIQYVDSESISAAHKDLLAGSFDLFLGSWVLDFKDPQNSWEGIRLNFIPALSSNADLKDFGLPDDFRTQIQVMNSSLIAKKTTKARFSQLREIEQYLTDTKIIIPLYSEQTGVLSAKGLNLIKGKHSYARDSYWDKCKRITN